MDHNRTTNGYLPAPYTLRPLPQRILDGLVITAALATLSTLTALLVLSFITYLLITWRQHHKDWVLRNPSVVLVYNLLLADLFQASSYLIDYHWISVNGILAPTGWCHVQGAFLNLGDVASAGFVLAIALHTLYTVVLGRRLEYVTFCSIILAIWIFATILMLVGPLKYGKIFFASSGNWCWISPDFETERLVLHYLWIFLVEFGTVVIYCGLCVYLYRRTADFRIAGKRSPAAAQMTRAAQFMLLYPLAYVIITLPIASARMVTLSGGSPANAWLQVAGALLASQGFVDALLYTLTRRILVNTDSRTTPDASESTYSKGVSSSTRLPLYHHSDTTTKITGGPRGVKSQEDFTTQKSPSQSPLPSIDSIKLPNVNSTTFPLLDREAFGWSHTVTVKEERTNWVSPRANSRDELKPYHKWET